MITTQARIGLLPLQRGTSQAKNDQADHQRTLRASAARIAVVSWIFLGLAACGQANDPSKDSANESSTDSTAVTSGQETLATPDCMLTVGWDPWEPYSFETVRGEVTGLDVEIVREVATNAGCSLSFTKGDWVELLNGVQTGEIDLLMSATPTAERRAYARFSEAYRDEQFVIFAREGDDEISNSARIDALIAGEARIGITGGYFYGDVVEAALANPATSRKFKSFDVPEASYAALVASEIDVAIGDPFVAAAVLRRRGIGDDVRKIPGVVHSGAVHLMLSKQSVDADTVERLNAGITQARSSGRLDRLKSQYLR